MNFNFQQWITAVAGVEGHSSPNPNDPLARNNSPKPIDEQELAELENEIGDFLPESYRAFLRAVGGVFFTNPVIVRPLEVRKDMGDVEPVGVLYGSCMEDRYHLLEEMRSNNEIIPTCLISIGDDGAVGNLFCLGIDREARGRVYLWDHDWAGDKESFDNITLVANSFDEFLARMEVDTEYR